MSDLTALAEKVEALTGPDFETDCDIEVVVNGGRKDLELGFECLVPTVTRKHRRIDVPRYTASLDAAMTLVPEGWVWQLSNRAPRPNEGRAYLHNGELIFAGIGGSRPNPRHKSVEVVARTAVVALTAAALRALSSQRTQS